MVAKGTKFGPREKPLEHDPSKLTKHAGGRPTKYNPELAEKICTYVRAGNYIEVAAGAVGIDRFTLYDWLKRGGKEIARLRKETEKPDPRETPFVEFSHMMQKAINESEARDVLNIAKAAESQWQASAWRLERRNFKRWGRKQALEVTGRDRGPITIETAKEKLAVVLERLAERFNNDDEDKE